MVGVAGKFKGCNTCKARRVKCDNERPACRKCKDSDRECGGYERERIFIVGTAKDRGRCSSHPHRLLNRAEKPAVTTRPRLEQMAKVRKRASSSLQPSKTSPVRIQHEFGSSMVRIQDPPSSTIQCVSLQTKLDGLMPVATNGDQKFVLALPENGASSSTAGRDFSLRGLCFTNTGPVGHGFFDEKYLDAPPSNTSSFNEFGSNSSLSAMMDHSLAPTPGLTNSRTSSLSSNSSCLFLYESNPSTRRSSAELASVPSTSFAPTSSAGGQWRNMLGGSAEVVKEQGPNAYAHFPDHYFFTRLFRPNACYDAISQRHSTFLSDAEWCEVPWNEIAKTDMDRLLDLQLQLPAIFERGEMLEGWQPTISRCLQAKQLLDRCHDLDRQFEGWYVQLQARHDGVRYSVVSSPSSVSSSNIEPLASEQYQFIDTKYAFLHLYYWAGKALFYRAIQHIHTIASQAIPTSKTRNATPPQPLFTPQPAITQSQYMSMVAATNPFAQNYTFSHDPLSFMVTTPTSSAPFFFPSQPQLYTPSSEDLFHFHQEVLDPATPLIPQPNPIPFFNFSVEPYLDVSAASYSDSPMSSSQFGSTAASFTSQSRSGTPARQTQPNGLASPPLTALSYSVPQSSRQLELLNLNEKYIAPPPPPPTVPPLERKYSEAEVLGLAQHICHAIPYALTSTITQVTSQPRSVTSTPSPVARRGSTFSSFSNQSSPPPTQAYATINRNYHKTSGFTASQAATNNPTILSEYGPDAAIWPLETATKVFRRQQREEEFKWGIQTLEALRREGSELAERVRGETWREWP